MISINQSSLRSGDSCINQLLPITHEIYQSFDDNLEVRAVFLDISKAFDKVWHKGLILKLKQKCISDKILNIITDFLTFRKQRVILNGKSPLGLALEQVCSRTPYLDHFYFWFYIIYLSDNLSATAKFVGDDTFLFSLLQNVNTSASHLNSGLS